MARSYAEEKPLLSWFYVLSAFFCLAVTLVLTGPSFPLWVRIPASLITGLSMVRVFVIYHDYEHGAILRNSLLGQVVMSGVGVLFLRSPAEWRRSHNFHHQNNARFATASIGSFPIKTTEEWKTLSPKQRLGYRIIRSPWVIVFAYITCFLVEAFKKLFFPDWNLKLQSAATLIVHGALMWFTWHLGPDVWFLSLALPFLISSCVGVYLFYVQHNFEGVDFKPDAEWDYVFAAMKSSSCLDCGPLTHWFTANIGYHHVHHLNPRIPFYRLPEANLALAEFHKGTRVGLGPREIVRNLGLKLWDADASKMVGFPANS